MKIEKVNNGFLITVKRFVPRESNPYATLGHMATSSFAYKIPCDEVEERYIFEKWSEAQLFIRKHFGVIE